MTFPFRMVALATALSLSALSAAANPYAEYISARLLPGWRAADGTHMAGLELDLADGWKTYWRQPGSAGIPPSFDWTRSGNTQMVEVIWPNPEIFELSGMRSIGYKHRVVLPLKITPGDPSEDVHLSGQIHLGICETVCVPLSLEVSADLSRQKSGRDPAIVAALASRPFTAKEARLTRATCRFEPQQNGVGIEARLTLPSAGQDETAVFELPQPEMFITDAVTRREGDTLIARATLLNGGPMLLDRSQLRITVLGGDHAVEITGCSAG
ncbi:protein-disulfide reductase DsbD domain-containing protein [Pseudooceanicola algae]|uniref:Thiol:disulfide interchange protein DsbD N-terminal domain-containing protein n=1 Tax=Pseudooceanicola algae TaxID=1537215 RepID=A0A418SKP0_9RHOB|nr:protein-disulfide reductase DsbD domain-containing protein [Pseudooceanicola algae]QPM90715.1 hypothetical protein PSAL_019540 [Pseudooceanicola algae]